MHRAVCLLALLALGCSEDPASMALDQAPPPFVPVLEIGRIIPGQIVDFAVTGVPQGAQVYVLWTTAGPGAGPCHPTRPICSDLNRPFGVLLNRVVGASGEIRVAVTAPPALDQVPHWFQAIVLAPGAEVKTPVTVRVVNDSDGDWVIDPNDNCPDVPNGYQFDDDADGYGLECDCDDTRSDVNPDGFDDSFDGIDQDCDGVDGNDAPPIGSGDWDGAYSGPFEIQFSVLGTVVPCLGNGSVTVDENATPQVVGSGVCSALGLPILLDIEGSLNPTTGATTGFVDDGSGPVSYTGLFFDDMGATRMGGEFQFGVAGLGTGAGSWLFTRTP